MLVVGNIFAVLGSLGFAFSTEFSSMILMRILFGVGVVIELVSVALLIVSSDIIISL
jgi:hypothetical protein